MLRQSGLTIEGETAIAHALNIWFRADLTAYLAHRPGVLAWNLAPGPLPTGRLGTLICHQPYEEFVLVTNYDPEAEDPAAFDEEDLVEADEASEFAPTVAEMVVEPLTIPEAKRRLAFTFGVDPSAIKITVEG